MATLVITLLFILLSAMLVLNDRKWFPVVFATFYFVLPKEAVMIADMKPNILILIVMLGVLVYNGRQAKLLGCKFYKIILFFFITSAFIALFSIENVPYASQISFLTKKSIEMFLLGIISVGFVLHISDVYRFVNIFCIFVFVGSLYGIFSYVIHATPYMDFISTSFRDGIPNGASDFLNEVRGSLNGRIAGFANHPLTWGQYHLLFLLTLPLFKKYINGRLFIITFIFSSINILLTGSRSSMAPLAFFFIGYFLIENRKNFIKFLTIGGLFFFALIALSSVVESEYLDTLRAYVFFWDESASEKISVGGSSVSLREDQFDNALYFISGKRLLFGFGYGFVSNMSEDHFMRETLLGFESVFLKVLVEQGFLGVFFYVAMFVFLCISLMKSTHNVNDKLYVLLMFVCYFTSLVLTGERCTFQLFFFFLVLIMQERKVFNRDLLLYLKSKSIKQNE